MDKTQTPTLSTYIYTVFFSECNKYWLVKTSGFDCIIWIKPTQKKVKG